MDAIAAFTGLLFRLAVFAALVLFVRLLFRHRPGRAGEIRVERLLSRLQAEALHDIVLTDGRGGLTQIDHLVLTDRALLVLETKEYSGTVLGRERESHWTQRLGGKSYRFQNPLRQNYLHLAAVRMLASPEAREAHLSPAKARKDARATASRRRGNYRVTASVGPPSGARVVQRTPKGPTPAHAGITRPVAVPAEPAVSDYSPEPWAKIVDLQLTREPDLRLLIRMYEGGIDPEATPPQSRPPFRTRQSSVKPSRRTLARTANGSRPRSSPYHLGCEPPS